MNRIVYNGAEYTDADIVSAELFSELSPISETLGYGTFNAVVKSETTAILNYTANTPLQYFYNGNLFATYYVNRIVRQGKSKYAIAAYDIIGVLSKQQHMGGIYTGQTSKEIITDVCGGSNIVFDEEVENIRLYGWLPIGTRRDNLRRVLFALGAVAKSTRSGELYIAALSARVVAQINKIGVGAEVEYPEPVGSVSLTEHQFIKSVNAKAETLFEGVTEEGDVITFDEPVYDLTTTGMAIRESHANYAIVGAGNGTLSGKKYAHLTRELSQALSGGSEEAVYSDATLVSVVNSAAVLARLVNYHAQGDIITADTRHQRQAPGDTVNILHPYDLNLSTAFLLDRQITVSRELVSYQRFLLGFVPPDPSEGVYNRVDVITSDGTFVVPEGVTSLRIVLIGGGTGGTSGARGENGTAGGVNQSQGAGGAGGAGGAAGTPGKVYQATFSVTPGQQFAVAIGAAGAGGTYSAEGQNAGGAGGETSFGAYSSLNGAISENGFVEEVSGVQYALPGQDGEAGSAGTTGGSGNQWGPEAETTSVTYEGQTWHNGATGKIKYLVDSSNTVLVVAWGGGGGGAAVGANGADGTQGSVSIVSSSNSQYSATGGVGGNGAAPTIQPPIAATYGSAGNGGHGGGGGGGGGGVLESYGVNWGGGAGTGAAGSAGGDGASGCALVYYHVPWTVNYNLYLLADGAELITSDGVTFIVKRSD